MNESIDSSPRFGAAERDLLRAQLPTISFAPALDMAWLGSAGVQAYLDYYAINFAKTRAGVVHGFGALDACGFRIATHYWLPENPRGTLVVVHGYYDHVGIFGNVIEFGLAQGLAVLAFDLPGHGLSSGEPVAIDSFDQYADVLDALLSAMQPSLPAPYYALGQSTGGSVLLNYLWRYDAARVAPRLQRIALCAPLILPRGWRRSGRFLYALVHRFIQRMPRGRSHSSHSPGFTRFVNELDCLQSPTLSVRWVGAMKAWDQQFRAFPPLANSVLILQGTDDQTVAWHYNLRQMARNLPLAKLYFIEGAGHQLVNESDEYRTQVFAKLHDYFCTLP